MAEGVLAGAEKPLAGPKLKAHRHEAHAERAHFVHPACDGAPLASHERAVHADGRFVGAHGEVLPGGRALDSGVSREVRARGTGAYGGHADARAVQLACERGGERQHEHLRRAVERVVRAGRFRHHRAHVEDAPVAAFEHGLQEHARQLGEARDAHLDHRADVGHGKLRKAARWAVARVVHEDVDLFSGLAHALEYGARGVGMGQVAGHGQHVDAEQTQVVSLFAKGLLVAGYGDQIVAVAGEQKAEGFPDAACRSGDQCGVGHDGAPFSRVRERARARPGVSLA